MPLLELGACVEVPTVNCVPGSLPQCAECYRTDIIGPDVAPDLFNSNRPIEIPLEAKGMMQPMPERTQAAVTRRIAQ